MLRNYVTGINICAIIIQADVIKNNLHVTKLLKAWQSVFTVARKYDGRLNIGIQFKNVCRIGVVEFVKESLTCYFLYNMRHVFLEVYGLRSCNVRICICIYVYVWINQSR
jgi:hypothetical protein